jgi:hypothetical protein
MIRFTTLSGMALAAALGPDWADVSQETIDSLGAPDSNETSIGTQEFKDGVPSDEAAQTIYDTLDFTRARSSS